MFNILKETLSIVFVPAPCPFTDGTFCTCSFHLLICLLSFSFIDWAHETLSSVEDSVIDHFRLLGVVEALAAIFKVCVYCQIIFLRHVC